MMWADVAQELATEPLPRDRRLKDFGSRSSEPISPAVNRLRFCFPWDIRVFKIRKLPRAQRDPRG